MTLSKPALMSAFLCPGVGQWVAGKRALGALFVVGAVAAVVTPFLLFMYSLLAAPPCDPFEFGVMGCTWRAVVFAWEAADAPLGIGLLAFAVIWVAAVLHANRLSLPERN